MLKFLKQNSPTSLEVITEFEEINQIILPNDYKEFLLRINGGEVKYGVVEYLHVNGKHEKATITDIYGLPTTKAELEPDSIEVLHVNEKYDPLLVIANEIGGHLNIVISLAAQHFGNVYIWLYSNSYITKICDSFDKFVDTIQFENEV